MKKFSVEQTIQISLEYYRLKQYKQVTQILQPLSQHIVQNDGIYLLMGNAYYCLGQYQQAIDAYLNGIQINANVAESYINLGNAYARLKSYDDAIDAYSKSDAINPDFLQPKLNLIYVYSAAQQTENAIKMCGQVLDNKCDTNSLEVALKSKCTRNNPSPNYLSLIDMYNKLHIDGDLNSNESAEEVYAGRSVIRWVDAIKKLITLTNSRTLLDYGSGKGLQYQSMPLEGKGLQDYWKIDDLYCYDPGYPPYRKFPQKQYDAVIATDVLEHCDQKDVKWVIEELFGLTRKVVFANIACFKSNRTLPDGQNAHCTVSPGVWWNRILRSVTPDYPSVKYCFLIEYFFLDVVGQGRIFQILSDFNDIEKYIKCNPLVCYTSDGKS